MAAGSGNVTRLYLDPPTGKVQEATPGGGFIGWVRSFHENLTLREYMGREIVGLVGFAMLISSLSGIYLWWPARGRFREALGARPGLRLSRNLHYLFGIYGAIVLGDAFVHRHLARLCRRGTHRGIGLFSSRAAQRAGARSG